MKLSDILLVTKYLLKSRFDRDIIFHQLEHEREIMGVISVLPMKYTYKQVEKALKAAKATPEMIYISLATGEHTLVLEQFYAALNVQGEREQGDMSDDWREEEWW